MIERKTFLGNEHSINVVTEQMTDSGWAMVASITHYSPTGEKTIDLPVSDTRYPTRPRPKTPAFDDGYLATFGLHRPLKDLPHNVREVWHVEAIKD